MPSEVVLNSKKKYVEELVEKLKASKVGVLISYKGIDVETDLKLRRELREAGVSYFVVKNSMLRFAFKTIGYDLDEHLSGSTAIAITQDDPLLVSKILFKYSKELVDKAEFFVKAGFLDGNIVGADLINKYGSLPTKEELYSMVLNVVVSPIRGFVVAMKALADKKSAG